MSINITGHKSRKDGSHCVNILRDRRGDKAKRLMHLAFRALRATGPESHDYGTHQHQIKLEPHTGRQRIPTGMESRREYENVTKTHHKNGQDCKNGTVNLYNRMLHSDHFLP